MPLIEPRTANRLCPCGCGRQVQIHVGGLEGDDGTAIAFRAVLKADEAGRPQVWAQLGMAPWQAGDPRFCWVTLHTWGSDGQRHTRVADIEGSPFADWAIERPERRLSRAEVMARQGAMAWAIEASDVLYQEHPAIARYLVQAAGAPAANDGA